MGSNHMHSHFRKAKELEQFISVDKKEESNKVVVETETDLDKLNRLLITTAEADVGIRRKILLLKKFIETIEG